MVKATGKPGIGHNSVQIPHNGSIPEGCWRDMERRLLRGERTRLIRKGSIIPAYRMPPQMMVRDENGRWTPELKTYNISEGDI